jgi:hypothetical protein
VSSGVFDAIHFNKFEEPDDFKKLLWNVARPSPGSMIILLDLLKDDLEADHAGLPTDFDRILMKLSNLWYWMQGRIKRTKLNLSNKSLRSWNKLIRPIPTMKTSFGMGERINHQ